MEESVAVLGLGMMGSALAGALLSSEVPTTVWNRTADRAEPLRQAGARVAVSIDDAVASSALVVLCVTDDAAADAVLERAGGSLAGRTVADLTTRAPGGARRASDVVTAAGGVYLDGVVQAQLDQIGTPDAAFLLSGPSDAYARHRPRLDALGTTHHVGDRAGQAALFDLALMGLWYDAEVALLEAIALVGSDGAVDHEALVPFAQRQFGYVVDAIASVAAEVSAGDYPRGPATLVEHAPVIEHLVAEREQAGMDPAHLRQVLASLRRRIDAGHGDDGFTSIVEELRPADPPA